MDRAAVKSYAPQARRDFLQAVTDRAAYLGLSADGVEPAVRKGDVVVIGGRAFPAVVAQQRKALEARIKSAAPKHSDGFHLTVEALAYTWFNRLVAVRYMELHDYLENGTGGASFRVLSHPDGKATPEILDRADEVELPGLKRDQVIGLKLDGKEPELYRLLLVSQCNALHAAMPFLFEKVADETELVLPDNLLTTDSLVRKLVAGVPEDDWKEVEVIGWLYEAYNAERYAEVIGKVVLCDDIPVATQKFTPKWVVQYLVQNTVGRLWLSTYPDSPLKAHLRYYVEPAEQTEDVQRQLAELTPTSLNPEAITMLEPACGSGHILAVGYDVFKAIYQERGYRQRDIPALILGKNLVGLEIDERAAQLASFTLMMKARADDARIFTRWVQPRVMALLPTRRCGLGDLTGEDIADALNTPVVEVELPPSRELFDTDDGLYSKTHLGVAGEVAAADVSALLKLFENAHCAGSMIRIPEALAGRLPVLEARARLVARKADDLFTPETAEKFLRLVVQSQLLARRYNCVVANPPYMGRNLYEPGLKKFVDKEYKDAKADLCTCFIQRDCDFAVANGFIGMITWQNWMFLSSFEKLRIPLFVNQAIDTFVHNGRGIFGSDFGSCSFVLRNTNLPTYKGVYRRLFDKQGSVASLAELEERFFKAEPYLSTPDDFEKLPGEIVAYWISDSERKVFAESQKLSAVAEPRQGLATADDEQFLRLWHEVGFDDLAIGSPNKSEAQKTACRWFPFTKGGAFRRWYGNNDYVVDWEGDGERLKAFRPRSVIRNEDYYFRPGITWSLISISSPSFREFGQGFVIGHKGPAIYSEPATSGALLPFLNSSVATRLLSVMSPAVGFEIGQVQDLPYIEADDRVLTIAAQLVDAARLDWDHFETSWDFQTLPVLQHKAASMEQSQDAADAECLARFARMKELEEENNRLFIAAYGLQEELSPEVPDEQITLYRPDRANDVRRLLSYIVGCVMGRYSLDTPGLVYAYGGNVGFEPAKYPTFPADADGIVPLLDTDWGFPDDAVNRVIDFVGTVWPKESLEANLRFLAGSLDPKANEPARETIRRYFAVAFFKDHLKTYKRRPIYWLFSSGKERAFQALVYLHRIHAGTVARLRTEYVIKLQSRIDARIEQLATDIAAATITSHRNKLTKEQGVLKKQQAELLKYDELLRHAADQQITLDLDDGVKANYAKFEGLLAGAKEVCGAKDDE